MAEYAGFFAFSALIYFITSPFENFNYRNFFAWVGVGIALLSVLSMIQK